MKKIGLLLALSLLIAGQAFAHVTNERTVYSDIALSEAASDILLLDLLGVISAEGGSQEFRPRDPLLVSEFAAWMETFSAAAPLPVFAEGEGVDYGLVNRILFSGQLNVEKSEGIITREAFATFTADHAEVEIEGVSLIERAGFEQGPDGKITAVKKADGGYILEIEGTEYRLGTHPRIASDSTDPAVWEGMGITGVLIGPDVEDGEETDAAPSETGSIQYAEIVPAKEDPVTAEEASAEEVEVADGGSALASAEASNKSEAETGKEAGRLTWSTALVVLAAGVFVYWLNRKKKSEIDN